MIAADTSSLIAFFNNDKGKDVEQIIEATEQKQLVLPCAVLSEILSNPQLSKSISQIIIQLPILDTLPGFWQRTGKIRSILLGKKLKARIADALIAQNCIDHNTALITRDSDFRHFAKHCNLKLLL